MTQDREPGGKENWDRTEWAGSVAEQPGEDEATADTDAGGWNKTEWVGDQGEGAPAPISREDMAEGDTSISGNRHTAGEQHWADTAPEDPVLDRTSDARIDDTI